MATFEVTLSDRTIEEVGDADAYQQEGPMTTFFSFGAGRDVIDCWSERVASVRTKDILVIRRAAARVVAAAGNELRSVG